MIIIVNGNKFRSFHRAMEYAKSIGKDITLQISDTYNKVIRYEKHFETFSDVRVISHFVRMYHNGNCVICKQVFTKQQACDLIDHFFMKYGAYNYELESLTYVNGRLIDGTLELAE